MFAGRAQDHPPSENVSCKQQTRAEEVKQRVWEVVSGVKRDRVRSETTSGALQS
jgi:hypothetical protein